MWAAFTRVGTVSLFRSFSFGFVLLRRLSHLLLFSFLGIWSGISAMSSSRGSGLLF